MTSSRASAVLHRLGFMLDGILLVQTVACVTPDEALGFCDRLKAWSEGMPDPDRLRAIHAQPVVFVDERRAPTATELVDSFVALWWAGAQLLDRTTWPIGAPARADLLWWQTVRKSAQQWSAPAESMADPVVLTWSFVWNRGGDDDVADQRHVRVPADQMEPARLWLGMLGARQESQGRILASSVAPEAERPAACVSFEAGLEHLAHALREHEPQHPWVDALRSWALALQRQVQPSDLRPPRRTRQRA